MNVLSAKSFFKIVFIGLLLSSSILFAQPCSTDNLTLETQEQIDNFSVNYPNCDELTKNLTIFENTPGNITNLLGLSQLKKVRSLIIQANTALPSLDGLENLEEIPFRIYLGENPSLNDLSALSQIEEVEELNISLNESLLSLEGVHNIRELDELIVFENVNLLDLKGLRGIESILPSTSFSCYASPTIKINRNHALVNLEGLEGLTSFENCILISENDNLISLKGLDNLTRLVHLLLRDNISLSNIQSLSQLKRLDETFQLKGCPLLQDLSGLEQLEFIGSSIGILENQSLTNLNGLANVKNTLASRFSIFENPVLSNIDGILQMGLENIWQFEILDNPNLSFCSVPNICRYVANGGSLVLENNQIGCNTLVEVVDACDEYAKVKVETYYDVNGNKIQDLNERLYADAVVQVLPDSTLHYPGTAPERILVLPHGQYEIKYFQEATPNWMLTTDSLSYQIELLDSFSCDTLLFGMTPINQVSYIQPHISSSFMICNLGAKINFGIKNQGATIADGIFWVRIDEDLQGLIFDNPPDEVSANFDYGWYFSDLYPGESMLQKVNFLLPLPPDIMIGKSLSFSLFGNYNDQLGSYLIDTITDLEPYRCSWDPNDKLVHPDRADHTTRFDENLVYTVRFQNTGNYFATDVIIKDTLHPNVNFNSLRVLSTSHPNQLNTIVDSENIISFEFENIYLPDSTSDFLESQGYVTFMVKPNSGLSENAVITNSAAIYFDSNPPIFTNTTKNIFVSIISHTNNDFQTLTFNLSPNPTDGIVTINDLKVDQAKLEIFDLYGRNYYQQEWNGKKNIDVSNLPNGVYFLKITIGSQVGIQRFVKT